MWYSVDLLSLLWAVFILVKLSVERRTYSYPISHFDIFTTKWKPHLTLHIFPLPALWKRINFIKLYVRDTQHKLNNTCDEYVTRCDNCVFICSRPPSSKLNWNPAVVFWRMIAYLYDAIQCRQWAWLLARFAILAFRIFGAGYPGKRRCQAPATDSPHREPNLQKKLCSSQWNPSSLWYPHIRHRNFQTSPGSGMQVEAFGYTRRCKSNSTGKLDANCQRKSIFSLKLPADPNVVSQ